MENLDILWLDDQRNPNTYFKKKPTKEEGTLFRNLTYYKNNIFNRYNVTFRWAHNYEDFIKEITTKMPDFISFDYDLKNGRSNVEGKLPNGIDCAKWLMKYCEENGVPMPKSYVHSANPKHGPELNSLLGLSENKKRTIKLTESKLKSIITECIKQTLKENQEYLPHGVSDIQNELIEIKRIIGYLVNDYLDSISQEQLDELGDMTMKYFQFLSGFMKKIDTKRW